MKSKCITRMGRAGVFFLLAAWVQAGTGIFNVREQGAVGDGKTSDTAALNHTVEACAAAGGGQVLFPPGQYLTGTINLRSNVTLFLEAGAEIVGSPDLEQYRRQVPASQPVAGAATTRSSEAVRWTRGGALVLGVGVENVTIAGSGVINGNKVFDPRGEEKMRGPHAILFRDSKNITIRDLSIKDAANYAVLLESSSQVDVRGIKVTGGWHGVHLRGRKGSPCRDINITNCEFYTGDDCIAGLYWERTLVANCILNSSCNGIRLIGPATNFLVHNCLFFGPGRFEHRTSGVAKRNNMLAGLSLQPGEWEKTEGPLDDVRISNITMHNVTTPVRVSLKPGNVGGRFSIDRLTATGVYRAAASFENWAQAPIESVTLRDVSMEFVGGGVAEQAGIRISGPSREARPLPAWGIYARGLKSLQMQNVRLGVEQADARPVIVGQDVGVINLDTVKFPGSGASPVLFDGVREVALDQTAISLTECKCTDLKFTPDPLCVVATVENTGKEGLAKVEISLAGQTASQWVWLQHKQTRDVTFMGLTALASGQHQLHSGDVRRDVVIK